MKNIISIHKFGEIALENKNIYRWIEELAENKLSAISIEPEDGNYQNFYPMLDKIVAELEINNTIGFPWHCFKDRLLKRVFLAYGDRKNAELMEKWKSRKG